MKFPALLTIAVERSLERENRDVRSERLTAKIKELGSRPGGKLPEIRRCCALFNPLIPICTFAPVWIAPQPTRTSLYLWGSPPFPSARAARAAVRTQIRSGISLKRANSDCGASCWHSQR